MNNFFDKKIKLGKKTISNLSNCMIIAEAGVAHFGSIKKAHKLVDIAVKSKADFFKIQLFQAESLVSNHDKEWQIKYKKKELNDEEIFKIDRYCKSKKIIPVYTFHDESKLRLINELKPPFIKIGSGELNNYFFLKKLLNYNLPLVISLGLHSTKEIKDLINFLKKNKKKDVIFMHCTTAYPTPIDKLNLLKIKNLKEMTNAIVGYSDHTKDGKACIYSIFLGSKIIERHITLKKDIPNAQDWKVSSNEKELISLIKEIKMAESMLGNKNKTISKIQKDNLYWATKSLFASRDLDKGEVLNENDINIKRPFSGLPISKYKNIIGKKIKRKLKKDQPITSRDV